MDELDKNFSRFIVFTLILLCSGIGHSFGFKAGVETERFDRTKANIKIENCNTLLRSRHEKY